MKRILFILISIACFSLTKCSDDVDIQIPENYEKAEITGITVYNGSLSSVPASVTIYSESASVNVLLNSVQDLSNLKVTLTISAGATVTKPLGTELQDYSSPRQVTIKSPGGSVEKEWLIEIVNP